IIDLPRAEGHFRKAEALFLEMPPNESMAQLYCHWSFICTWRAQVAEAFQAARRAVEIAEELGNSLVQTYAAHAMANSLFAMGRLREAVGIEDRPWHEADRLNDPSAGGISQNGHFILIVLRDYRESLRWLRREMERPRNKQPLYYGFFARDEEISINSAMG